MWRGEMVLLGLDVLVGGWVRWRKVEEVEGVEEGWKG